MRLVIENDNPSIVKLIDLDDRLETIKASLTYTDKAAVYAFQKFKKSSWQFERLGPERYNEMLNELKDAQKKCILFTDENGVKYTYSGLADYLSKKFRVPVDNLVNYPDPQAIPWAKEPPYKPYDYQILSRDKLLEARHAGVSLGTGLGKSHIILMLVKALGLKTIIMTPATSISEQLYENFVTAFGKKYVGKFFDGKKESNKLITIGNAQSLTKIAPDSPAWRDLSKTAVFVADESHQCPASTLEAVCFGLAAKAPYRFFFSATQMRNDGKDIVLDGITGPIVYNKTVREGVDEGYLSKPLFRMVHIDSTEQFSSTDANAMTRKHLYYNDRVVAHIAKTVNASVAAGNPTVVLIEEVEQFTKLLPYLRHEVGFAHGPLSANKEKVPPEYWESDPTELVKKFNDLKLPILVGTSCITTGTDIRAVKTLVYWQGGKSEIQVKQAIGRGTRLFPGKKTCIVIDYNVKNIDVVSRHAEARAEIYNELYPSLKNLTAEMKELA